jgi:hypothetical protein
LLNDSEQVHVRLLGALLPNQKCLASEVCNVAWVKSEGKGCIEYGALLTVVDAEKSFPRSRRYDAISEAVGRKINVT